MVERDNSVAALLVSLSDVQVNLAIQGMLNGYLPPAQWEALRLELQRIYRRATGEEFATVVIASPTPERGDG